MEDTAARSHREFVIKDGFRRACGTDIILIGNGSAPCIFIKTKPRFSLK